MADLSTMTGKLGDILLSQGRVTREGLQRASSQDVRLPGERLGDALLRLNLVTDEHLREALAIQYRLPFLLVNRRLVDRAVFGLLPHTFLARHRVVPMFRIEDEITVAVEDPTNLWMGDEIERLTGCAVLKVVTSAACIRSLLDDVLDDGRESFDIDEFVGEAIEGDVQVIEEQVDDMLNLAEIAGMSPIVRLVNYVLFKAIGDRASDIHIEPDDHVLRIRHRVDGELRELMRPPASMHPAIVSRLKVMADLDISERRQPQDGRFRVRLENRAVDVRVSTLPTVQGEKVVLRILDRTALRINLGSLGIGNQRLQALRDLIHRPDGILLVAGPTGSGKTTTLYAAIEEINAPGKNICTVENPVEYNLRGINQVQANQKGGLGFADALRSLLRQDPDVLMVGEIRDKETATIAVQASLTGHLVMATLHTNDAVSAVTRLINMGIEPYLIGAALRGVLSQRLVRCLCPSCREPIDPPSSAVRHFGSLPDGQYYTGRGCDSCRGTGYVGRIGIYELLVVSDDFSDLISRSPSLGELRRAAQKDGLMTLLSDGLRKASEGITSLDELLRVVWT
ncbi:MAG: Flp pilus assembly complex ATPase component TadA [Planctomycetes bacterium]|nr:Flp pilus assembly complex ATPase component TadA [Planctomycetota bacterium]